MRLAAPGGCSEGLSLALRAKPLDGDPDARDPRGVPLACRALEDPLFDPALGLAFEHEVNVEPGAMKTPARPSLDLREPLRLPHGLATGQPRDRDVERQRDLVLECEADRVDGAHLDLHAADPAKGLRQSCDECHEDDAENFAAEYLKPWIEESEEPLRAVLERLATAPQKIAAAARAEIEALLAAGAYHNKEHAEHTAKKWAAKRR